MKEIFISYVKEDKAFARKLVSKLESDGYSCWISPRDINDNTNKTNEIKEAVVNCEAFLLVLSKFSENSNELTEQIISAADEGVSVVPIKIGGISKSLPMQYFLHTLEWVDVYGDGFNDAYDILLEIIEEISEGSDVKIPVGERKRKAEKTELKLNKNQVIGIIVAIVIVISGIYFFNSGNEEEDNKDNNTEFTQDNIINTNLSESDKKLVGNWRIVDYQDDRNISDLEKNEILNALKQKGLLIFSSNKTFQRIGFSPQTETGTWQFNEAEKKIFLKSNNKTGSMNLSSFTENRMTMIVVEQIQHEVTKKLSTVTTKITFQKQKVNNP